MVIYLKKILLFIIILLPFNVYADSSKSSIVIDYDSGRVLYEKDPNSKMLIASTTKIMTCIVTLENSSLSKKVKVGEEITKVYGTNIYVEVGEELTVEDLLYGLMLRSGNDAAIVLANNIFNSEEEFVNKMNEKAQFIGMKNTVFGNPHGLDEDTKNYSTAKDMALLARYAYKNKEYRKIISAKKYFTNSSIKSYKWYNRMDLINNYKYCVGGKNGYTPKAGKTLVSYALKNNMTIITVSLDDSDCYENHKKIDEIIFDKFRNYTIIDKNNFRVDSSLVKKKVYLKKSFSYPLSKDELDKISTSIYISNEKNKIIGKVSIKLNSNEIGKLDIYSIDKKKENKSILHRIKNLIIR